MRWFPALAVLAVSAVAVGGGPRDHRFAYYSDRLWVSFDDWVRGERPTVALVRGGEVGSTYQHLRSRVRRDRRGVTRYWAGTKRRGVLYRLRARWRGEELVAFRFLVRDRVSGDQVWPDGLYGLEAIERWEVRARD